MARRRRTSSSRRTRQPRWTLLLLILASISIITLSYRGDLRGTIDSAKSAAHDVFSPVQRAVDAVVRPISNAVAGAFNYGSVQTQNAKLRQQVQALEGRQAAAADLQRRLQLLSQLEHLPFADVSTIPTITAQVIGYSTSDFADTVQLDHGSAAGVAVGMPVVGGAGLVGRVSEVWSSGCVVQLITDTNSAVAITFGSHANQAVASGRGHGRPLEIDYVIPGTPVTKGMVLTTSGLQHDLYPAGIPVARVTRYAASASATAAAVAAQPLADLTRLQYVDVLVWRPPPVPASAGNAP